jgi:hypothetical protein
MFRKDLEGLMDKHEAAGSLGTADFLADVLAAFAAAVGSRKEQNLAEDYHEPPWVTFLRSQVELLNAQSQLLYEALEKTRADKRKLEDRNAKLKLRNESLVAQNSRFSRKPQWPWGTVHVENDSIVIAVKPIDPHAWSPVRSAGLARPKTGEPNIVKEDWEWSHEVRPSPGDTKTIEDMLRSPFWNCRMDQKLEMYRVDYRNGRILIEMVFLEEESSEGTTDDKHETWCAVSSFPLSGICWSFSKRWSHEH